MSSHDPQRKGLFMVLDGTDGSGKSTQFKLLTEKLTKAGYDVAVYKFPKYDSESSYYVREYLAGKYGSMEKVGPYTASIFFALDRYSVAQEINEALAAGKIVIADRYTGANMAHQGASFENAEERRGYYVWLDNLESELLKIPRADFNLILRVPAETAQQLVEQRTDHKADIIDADAAHRQKSVQAYDEICELFPKDYIRFDCVQNGQLQTIETISNQIWDVIQPVLPQPNNSIEPTNQSTLQNTTEVTPLVRKNSDGNWTITAAGRTFLNSAVSNTNDSVYAFTEVLSPTTIAAAMARLSRRGDDMRITLLDEFAAAAGKDEALLQRVITAYGDDSVQQLVGQYLVVENASNLLTKKLEWGRLAAYLEQSTRYIYFDQKDSRGNYRYYTPDSLKKAHRKEYQRLLNQIFDLYSQMVRELTEYVQAQSTVPQNERDGAWKAATRAQACDAIRPVLPVATTSTVGIYASGQALESLIMHLLSDQLPEAVAVGQQILDECRKVIPTFLERADKADRGGATIAYRANTYRAMQELAQKYLPQTYSNEQLPVQLTSVWPRNETDLVADMLYEHASQPLKEIQKSVQSWSYERKLKVFEAYIGERLNRRHKPGRALEKAHYSFDLLCDYGIFRDLQRHRMVDDLAWQELTPRYGYEVPEIVESAGLTETFLTCFDISLQLHSYLQAKGYSLEAQYATLLGHRMRWKVTYNAREAFHLHELRTSPQGHPGYRKLVKLMHEQVAQVHPMLADAMRFVNKDEDPELTRLAAERYTQFKLNQLDK